MKDYEEIPGNKSELKKLLFPFHTRYPLKLWSKYRWWRNSRITHSLSSINRHSKWLTVIDRLGAPGDALITANIVRGIKRMYPKIKINCITPNPDLIRLDPNFESINCKESFYSFDSTYWELIVRKENKINIVKYSLNRLNIQKFEYKSIFYLSDEESTWAENKLVSLDKTKPTLAICTKSKEPVKNWPESSWHELIKKLLSSFSIIHLGDEREPIFSNVIRFAGLCSMRESAAILSKADFFIGPDSLLMHVANGLNIPSVIIFGGSRPVNCFGYSQNINLTSNPVCSPCWIHEGYELCTEKMKCLKEISVPEVLSSINRLTHKSI